MKKQFEKIRNYFSWLFSKREKGSGSRLYYRGRAYDKNSELNRKHENNEMSYRGISYNLLNSKIRVKEK